MELDHKIGRVIIMVFFFAVPGFAVLYGVFRSIKNGRVILFNKVTGHSAYLLRKDDPRGFWFPLTIYGALGIGLVCLAIYGIVHILSAKGSL
jgi:hypothetical protein